MEFPVIAKLLEGRFPETVKGAVTDKGDPWLEVAAEAVGLTEGEPIWRGILPDYTVPGLPDVVGYIVAGFAGVTVLLAPAALRGRRK